MNDCNETLSCEWEQICRSAKVLWGTRLDTEANAFAGAGSGTDELFVSFDGSEGINP